MRETDDAVIAQGTALNSDGELLTVRGVALLARRKKRALGLAVAGAGLLALLLSLLFKSSYTATTTIMPPQQNRSISSALLSQLGAASVLVSGESGIKDPNDLFIAMLQSRSVADALIQRYALESEYHLKHPEDLYSTLAGKTHIRSGKGGVISISVEDSNPIRAAALANGYVTELHDLNNQLAASEAGQRRAFFQGQYKIAEQQLLDAEREFQKVQQSTGILQLDAQSKEIVEATAALEKDVAAKEIQIQAIRLYATDDNPRLKLEVQELAALKEQLNRADKHQRTGTIDVSVSQLPTAAMEYATKLRGLKYKEGELEAMAKQLQIARIDEAKEAPVIQVIDPAVPPTKPSGPNRLAIIVAVAMSAFVLVLAWLVGWEYAKSGAHPLATKRLNATGQW